MTADDILNGIRAKHAEDVVVPECKTGPSQCASMFRIMDAWVMPKSWAHPDCTAYEIKVARNDFVNDRKWPQYLPYCNYFYFACPKDVIRPEELPPEAGLYYACGSSGRLIIKKKAARREVEIPESLFRYILMRVQVEPEHNGETAKDYWRDWLKNKDDDWRFGHRVGQGIRDEIEKRVSKVEKENHDLQERINAYDQIRASIKAMGFTEDERSSAWSISSKVYKRLEQMKQGLPEELAGHINQAVEALHKIQKAIAKHELE